MSWELDTLFISRLIDWLGSEGYKHFWEDDWYVGDDMGILGVVYLLGEVKEELDRRERSEKRSWREGPVNTLYVNISHT